MNNSLKNKKSVSIKARAPSKTMERRFGEANEHMINLMSQIYENQVLNELNKSTIDKFADSTDQSGNYARAFTRLSKQVRRKLLRRFSNLRIENMAKDFLEKSDRETQAKLYAAVESKVGISAKELALKEATRTTKNALILETAQWMQKLRDETLELYTANTLRQMTQGKGIGDIMEEFAAMKEKRKNHAKFTARNQINNFNSIMTKTRAQKIGIKKARWITSEDERVRNSHKDRNGKKFDLDKGLYSSLDGKTLLPATDYQCRCTYELIIEGDEDE
jgi:SPP1 gp7 family putative phage head morphogenesis protein